MGLKTLKERYDIVHIIQVRRGNICIGSGFDGEIIVISMQGKILKRYKNGKYSDGYSTEENLKRYDEMLFEDGRNGVLKSLIEQKDEHDQLYPVYTYRDGRVIKKYCEEYGWPNITIDGELMYENTFFKLYKKARAACRRDARLGVKCAYDNLMRTFSEFGIRFLVNSKNLVLECYYWFISLFL